VRLLQAGPGGINNRSQIVGGYENTKARTG